MELTTIWFIVIAVMFTGYFVLEGFDFGVGMLLPVLARGMEPKEAEERKRVMLTTIGPLWDGNEVWLITGVGAMFAAFPVWYATFLSGLYLPMLLVLLVVIVRNVGLEYRHKRQDMKWLVGWDRCIVLGSLVAPFTLGTMITALVDGLPINATGNYVGFLGPLFRPEALLGGVTLVALALVHGAFFLGLKTTGEVQAAAREFGGRMGPIALVILGLYAAWMGSAGGAGAAVLCVVSLLALGAALVADMKGFDGWAFIGTMVTFASIVGAGFVRLFPLAVPSSLNDAWSITKDAAASTPYTLTIMTWVAVIFVPIMLAYTSYNYWIFRRRVGTHQLAAH